MSKRLSNFETVSLAVNANNSVIPYNPARKWLFISNTNATAIYVQLGAAAITGSVGIRLTSSQDSFQLRYEDVGDLVTQPVSIWNAGSAGSTFAYGEAWDCDDL